MVKTIRTLLAIRISIVVNLLIYTLRKLPFLGKLIRKSAYANLGFKRVITIIAFLLVQLGGFATRFAYVGIMVYLPVVMLGEGLTEEQSLRQFLHLYAVISLAVACVSNATVLETKREKLIAVKLMRMSPTKYMKAVLGYRYATSLIYLLPALILFAMLAGATLTESIALTVLTLLLRVAAEYAHLKLFERTGVVLIKRNAIVWSVIILGYAAAYSPLLFGWVPSTATVLLSLPFYLVIVGIGLFAAVKLARYTDYREAVDAATKRDDPLLNLNQMFKDAEKQSVSMKDSDYQVKREEQGRLEALQGYAYLNALFFLRHRRLVRDAVNKRLAIIGAIGAVGAGLAIAYQDKVQQLEWGIDVFFPILCVAMLFLTVGERICKAMFYHCDLSLLRYGYYRNASYEHFRIRLGKLLRLNLLIAVALGAALTVIAAAIGGEWLNRELLMLWVCVIALAVFVTVHHLFMYYFFQPYATELNVKNPLFYLVNMAVSSVCSFSVFLRVSGEMLTAIILPLTLIYSLVAFVTIRKHGARRFRVK